MQPRIAIPQPTADNYAYNLQNWRVYADAVRASGGLPVAVALTSSRAALEEMARTMDGFLLPGSPFDVNPESYGQTPQPECAPADPLREQTDRILIEHAHSEAKPVFAICFGMQMLNVFYGGTLVQDLTILPVNHAAARGVHVAHSIEVDANSLLWEIFVTSGGQDPKMSVQFDVNSSHHQAVGIVGQDLVVVARSRPDGVVEAIEGRDVRGESVRRFVLGVQWHPERTYDSSPASRALFYRFVEAAALAQRLVHV